MEKIKLVQIIADSNVGGGVAHVLGILKNIDKNKFDCYLICPSGFLSKSTKDVPSVTVITLPFKDKYDIKTVLDLKKRLSKIQSSNNPFARMIVHAHGPRAGFFTQMVIPKDVEMIFTEHNYTKLYRLKNYLNNFVQSQMMNLVYRKSDQIIAVSSAVSDYLLHIKVPAKKISIIHNGFDVKPMISKRQADDNSIIGSIGNLNRQKGQIYLIRALPIVIEKYPDVKLEIIGDGDEKSSLMAEIQRLNIKKSVSLLGLKTDLQRYLSSWSIFVLPSVSETFGISILEAMAANIPVVATKSGGTVDIIKDKVNGLLVESRKPELLAKAIIKLLDDRKFAAGLAKSAVSDLSKFAWPFIIKKLEQIYLDSYPN